MSTQFIWQLPVRGDGRYANAAVTRRGEDGTRFTYFDYLHQTARAADLSGFDGIRIPHDLQGDESWIVAGYLARSTRRLILLTEFEAAWGSAVYAAKNAVTFQRYTNGRMAWQISSGASQAERSGNGDIVADSDVLARIDEFLTVARGVQTTAPYDFQGRFFEVKGGGFRGPLAGNQVPRVYLSGSSAAAYQLSARQADVHVLDADADLDAAIATLQALAQDAGRSLAIGLRLSILARATAQEALRDEHRQRAQSGAASDVVGSYEQVIARLADYAAAGVSSFILSAVPGLEEAYRIGEHILPALRVPHATSQQAA